MNIQGQGVGEVDAINLGLQGYGTCICSHGVGGGVGTITIIGNRTDGSLVRGQACKNDRSTGCIQNTSTTVFDLHGDSAGRIGVGTKG